LAFGLPPSRVKLRLFMACLEPVPIRRSAYVLEPSFWIVRSRSGLTLNKWRIVNKLGFATSGGCSFVTIIYGVLDNKSENAWRIQQDFIT
jgi:hypothetical protein